MSDVIIFDRMQQRRGTTANLAAVNEVLRAGEVCWESDTGKFKIGDGSTAWNLLNYYCAVPLSDPGGDRLLFWDDSASTWKHLTLGTGLSITDTTITAGGGGGAITPLGTATVAGSAATALTLSSLDLSTYKAFFVLFACDNATGSLTNLSLYYNSDTTDANYYAQFHTGDGSASTAARTNSALVGSIPANDTWTASADIFKDRDGRPRAVVATNRGAPASIAVQHVAHVRNNTANVTSITMSSSVASALAIGSTFSVYGVA